RYRALFRLFFGRYGRERWESLPYSLLLEKLHRLPDGDLEFLRGQGFFKVTVPEEFGGLDWWKAEYYLLCYLSARFADMAQALTIQVNDTLGTVPLLTAYYGDLPRARRDLEAFLAQPSSFALPAERQKLAEALRRSPALRLISG